MYIIYCTILECLVDTSFCDIKYKKSLKIKKNGNQNPNIEEEQTTKWLKGQTMIQKTLHRKQKFKQHEPHYKSKGTTEG